MNRLLLYFLSLLVLSCSTTGLKGTRSFLGREYPGHWWERPVIEKVKSWEILSDQVQPPQVILSKRNELGILSNFAATPFFLDGKKYGSVEGFWQAVKYPEGSKDLRFPMAQWPHSRREVELMVGFQAKRAGDFGSRVMKQKGFSWVSFAGKKIEYKSPGKEAFYHLIFRAMQAKLEQNQEVQKILCQTVGLELLPDHRQGANPPPAWRYHHIWMELRERVC